MSARNDVLTVLARGPVVGWDELARLSGWSRPMCRQAVAGLRRVRVSPTRPVVIELVAPVRTGARVYDLLAERPRTVAELIVATGYSERHTRHLLAAHAEIAVPARRCAPGRSMVPAVYRLREGA